MKKSTIFGLAAGIAFLAAAPVMAQETEQPVPFPYDFVLSPNPDEPATDLMNITITFTETPVYFYDGPSRIANATLVDQTNNITYYCETATRDTRAMAPSAYTMTFVEEGAEEAGPITAAGSYQLVITSLQTDADDPDTALPWIYANYEIEMAVDYELDPQPGIVDELSTISIDFTSIKGVEYYENSPMAPVVLENLATGDVYTCAEPTRNTRAMSDGTVYTFTFVDENDEVVTLTENGQYQLTIRGFYYEDENGEPIDIPVITANYTIGYPYEYELTPEDGAELDVITEVILNVISTRNVAFADNSRMPVAVLTNTTTGNEYLCYEPQALTFYPTSGKAWVFYFLDENDETVSAFDEDGVYTLSIKGLAETTYVEGEGDIIGDVLPIIEATYYVGSATSVAANIAAESYNVYSINGVKVISNGNAESLKSLNSGLYIVNGKKVIIRK